MKVMDILFICLLLCYLSDTEMDMLTRMNFGIVEMNSMTLTEKLQEIGKAQTTRRHNIFAI